MKTIFQSALEIKSALPIGKKFTLVGGCFDLIHVGHVHLFEYASSLEEILVVAVLSDEYVKKYKNAKNPVISQTQRAKMVASIRFVDLVYVSDVSPSSVETLDILKPHSVVFGEGSSSEEKMQRRIQNIKSVSPDTKIKFLPRYSDEGILSTGCIGNKIRAMNR